MQQLSPAEFRSWLDNEKPHLLVDVREAKEHAASNLGGRLIPLAAILKHLPDFDVAIPVVMYCKRGIRSQLAIQRLATRLPQVDFYNLDGGLLAWESTK
jgi:adenylyltransferase/sulfurtransferase